MAYLRRKCPVTHPYYIFADVLNFKMSINNFQLLTIIIIIYTIWINNIKVDFYFYFFHKH